MRVAVSVLRANGQPCVIAALAAIRCILRSSGSAAVIAVAVTALLAEPVRADNLPEALVRTYQNNPQLNAERARLRGVDEGVPQALAGYRPQLLLTLTGGLQQVRVLFFDNTIQTATLRTWTIGFTVSQTLFNGFKTANTVRQSESQVLSGREALRNTGQGVLLDAVTAYTNVIANQSLVEAQRINVTALRETLATTKTRLEGGDVTPTDVAQAEARLSRGLADLNAAEDGLAISRKEHPAILAAMYDIDVAQFGTKIAESSLWPTLSVQGSLQRQWENDPT